MFAGFSIANTIGRDLLFKTVYSTSIGIINICKYFVESDKPYMVDINKLLNKLDIKAKITILHDLIKEKEKKNIPKSVKETLIYVSESLDYIHKELDIINKKIDYHNTRYFNTWRTLDCSKNLVNIEYHNKILDKRVSLLFDLLKIK